MFQDDIADYFGHHVAKSASNLAEAHRNSPVAAVASREMPAISVIPGFIRGD